MAGLKRSQSNVQEVYYPLALFIGCGVVERHLEMAQPTKKTMNSGPRFSIAKHPRPNLEAGGTSTDKMLITTMSAIMICEGQRLYFFFFI